MRILVAIGSAGANGLRTTFWAPDEVHAGQWKPTEAGIMQSPQMGRPQRWQLTPARRSAWR
jgi:hypothetical protein